MPLLAQSQCESATAQSAATQNINIQNIKFLDSFSWKHKMVAKIFNTENIYFFISKMLMFLLSGRTECCLYYLLMWQPRLELPTHGYGRKKKKTGEVGKDRERFHA
jgi:hypothetical protein